MIISYNSNRLDWLWLFGIWQGLIVDESKRRSLDIITPYKAEYYMSRDGMKKDFGVKTEMASLPYGHRTFEIIDKEKFMMEKMKRK